MGKTVTITPASDELVRVTSVAVDVNADTVLAVTLTSGASFQSGSGAEGATNTIGTAAEGGGRTDCTVDANYNATNTSMAFDGNMSEAVTVRFYEKTSSVPNTSGMCMKNAVVTGKLVKRVNQQLGGQFRGSF